MMTDKLEPPVFANDLGRINLVLRPKVLVLSVQEDRLVDVLLFGKLLLGELILEVAVAARVSGG